MVFYQFHGTFRNLKVSAGYGPLLLFVQALITLWLCQGKILYLFTFPSRSVPFQSGTKGLPVICMTLELHLSVQPELMHTGKPPPQDRWNCLCGTQMARFLL